LQGAAPTGGESRAGRFVRLLVVDVLALSALIASTHVWLEPAADVLAQTTGLGAGAAHTAAVAGACVLAVPLLFGVGRLSHRLGTALAERALPRIVGRADFDATSRNALVLMVQLGVTLNASVVVLALT